ncbi:hypothetical protein BT63DRAFT_430628 [Microthyrium microscopicum]|uniref:DNA-directed RNA polymerase III subunit RPC6 n=1 Tax=Microthyrium microscopicum TaxID=703497 RepID=A0A6A6TUS5_9PEZI|nr:hypothetical protein BT63DRAFT_430628 [Microthyrium microscopicum]
MAPKRKRGNNEATQVASGPAGATPEPATKRKKPVKKAAPAASAVAEGISESAAKPVAKRKYTKKAAQDSPATSKATSKRQPAAKRKQTTAEDAQDSPDTAEATPEGDGSVEPAEPVKPVESPEASKPSKPVNSAKSGAKRKRTDDDAAEVSQPKPAAEQEKADSEVTEDPELDEAEPEPAAKRQKPSANASKGSAPAGGASESAAKQKKADNAAEELGLVDGQTEPAAAQTNPNEEATKDAGPTKVVSKPAAKRKSPTTNATEDPGLAEAESGPVVKRKKLNTNAAQGASTTTKNKRDLLYECAVKFVAGKSGTDISKTQLEEFAVTDNDAELMELCNQLLQTQQFRPYKTWNSTVRYRIRSKQDALKLAQLTPDSHLVYQHIEQAGQIGVWKKTLQSKTNMHENTITKTLKDLNSKKLIKEFKTSKNAAKRMYILYNLEPNEESTGGTFYTEGELDDGLVLEVGKFIVDYLQAKTWVAVKPPKVEKPVKVIKGKGKAPTTGKGKEPAESTEKETDQIKPDPPLFRQPIAPNGNPFVPQSADFEDYPTCDDIRKAIIQADFIKDMELGLQDIKKLVAQLVYDDRVEAMAPGRYRAVRTVWQEPGSRDLRILNFIGAVEPDESGFGPGNGFTQSPCGRCPVAKDCRIGGKVNPDTCVYMNEWLDQLAF